MNKLFALTALSALAAAAPAAAQSAQAGANAGGRAGIANRIAQLDTRLRAGIDAGTIDRAEARELRPQLRELDRLERRYSRNGLTQLERRDLQQRIRDLRQQIRLADNGRYDRYERYGYDDDDDGDDYADRDGYYGQGGPYDEVDEVCGIRPGGVRGVIGTILGGGDDCLSVGEQVTGSLGGLPSEYRGQFRDGGGYYYRYADGKVIQIDTRTQTVARIYDVDD